jgi:hypothetical protein
MVQVSRSRPQLQPEDHLYKKQSGQVFDWSLAAERKKSPMVNFVAPLPDFFDKQTKLAGLSGDEAGGDDVNDGSACGSPAGKRQGGGSASSVGLLVWCRGRFSQHHQRQGSRCLRLGRSSALQAS